jgi:hypothetical protein
VEDGTGDLFVGVSFANYGDPNPRGQDAVRLLARINADGSLDRTSPRPPIDERQGAVTALAKALDGSGDWLVTHNQTTLRYRVERQDWSGVRTDQPSASLALNYRQSRWLLISAMGNYSSMRSSDHLVDLENIGGKGMLAWELEPVRDWTPLLSLEAGYNLHVNRLLPSAQTEDLSGLLRLVPAKL